MTLCNLQRRYQRRFALLVAFALAVSVLPFDLPGVPLPAAEAGPSRDRGTVTVSNSGPDDATGVAVLDVVPAGYSSISNISSGGSLVGSTITWSGLSVTSGGSIDLTFDALVEAPSADYENVAQVTASDAHDPDSVPDNDDGDQSEDDEEDARLAPAIVGLAKGVTGVVNNGDGTYRIAYLLTFENLSTVTISDLELFDDVATHLAPLAPVDFIATDGTYLADPVWDGTAISNILGAGQAPRPRANRHSRHRIYRDPRFRRRPPRERRSDLRFHPE